MKNKIKKQKKKPNSWNVLYLDEQAPIDIFEVEYMLTTHEDDIEHMLKLGVEDY